MITVLQRVSRAAVTVDGKIVSQIGAGLLLLAGLEKGDTDNDLNYTARKTVELRIFPDDEGKMNRSVVEHGGAILAVSQFTLAGNIQKGRRPSFDTALPPDEARILFDRFVTELTALGVSVSTGSFGAHMEVSLLNDGPVTFIVDSHKRV
ncbi:MAG TPA: D-aminoacyl-tRNA deacylase [bacterium]|nr:D-aminoacyl-tRNA deacylase [bacterium]